ncbi:MAG: VWA domain-containing protein [Bacteroidota bacterium]
MEKLKVLLNYLIKKGQPVFYIGFVSLVALIFNSCHPAQNNLKIPEYGIAMELEPEIEINLMIAEEDDEFNTEEYNHIVDNPFMNAWQNPLSTFSIDVDHASYSNVRRFLNQNQLPPKGAVRIEEMINYFNYDYPEVNGEHPFELVTELGQCPWNKNNKLVHIGIQGKQLDYDHLMPSNLTFLIDVSGSMSDMNKLPLVKKSLNILLNELGDEDKVSIVVYAGAAGLVLPPTPASDRETIRKALKKLKAGGSTAGGEGIELAYKVTTENKIAEGNNRVILVTDGDFNVGSSSTSDMVELIESKRKEDIYLTICGFGMGNYKDGRMEQMSNAGNGNYFYIDNIKEADKVFRKEMRANMFTIARDVKIQIEFNPTKVKAYRLIGYENRLLENHDFEDDKKDAGELGAGHTVTALYEIIPAGSNQEVESTSSLRYQKSKPTRIAKNNELVNLNLRYKPLDSDQSILINRQVTESDLENNSDDFQFSAAVAGFGMILRDSPYRGNMTFDQVLVIAKNTTNAKSEERQEFIRLVEVASLIAE